MNIAEPSLDAQVSKTCINTTRESTPQYLFKKKVRFIQNIVNRKKKKQSLA